MALQPRHGKQGLVRQGENRLTGAIKCHRCDLPQDQQVAGVLDHWPALAAAAGLPDVLPVATLLMTKSAPALRRLVARLDLADGRALILKEERRGTPLTPDHFNDCVAAQESARLAISGNLKGLRVPKCLAHLPGQGLALFEFMPGQTAATLVEAATSHDDRRAALQACGRWLAELHRETSEGHRPYQTRFVLDYQRKLRADIAANRLRVAEPALFLRLSHLIEAGADWWDGHPARHARRHGDYSLRNVLMDGSRVSAIDFRPRQTGPVGHDVARLLVDFASLHGEHQKIPDGQILQGPYRTAFFKGYDFSGADDASIGFLYGIQILQDWTRIPVAEADRSFLQMVRLQGLVATAMRLFPDLRQE